MCVYATPMFYECYMRHGPHLTVVNHPTDYEMISTYTPNMLSSYPDSRTQNIELCNLPFV
jgi:hypothetical protein